MSHLLEPRKERTDVQNDEWYLLRTKFRDFEYFQFVDIFLHSLLKCHRNQKLYLTSNHCVNESFDSLPEVILPKTNQQITACSPKHHYQVRQKCKVLEWTQNCGSGCVLFSQTQNLCFLGTLPDVWLEFIEVFLLSHSTFLSGLSTSFLALDTFLSKHR